jgi:hypothetical protein
MPLDIHLESPDTDVLISLDGSEGLYWLIYPTLESIAEETGEMIDLYDNAVFENELLMELFLGLEGCVSEIKEKPETWKIEISKSVPSGEPNYAVINRSAAIEKLEKLMRVANDAYNDGKKLLFIGD